VTIVLVPKSDDTLRLCTDFRKVNAVTVLDRLPILRVEYLLDRVGQLKYLTKLDMTRGYWQVPLDEESTNLCFCDAFRTLSVALYAFRAPKCSGHVLTLILVVSYSKNGRILRTLS